MLGRAFLKLDHDLLLYVEVALTNKDKLLTF